MMAEMKKRARSQVITLENIKRTIVKKLNQCFILRSIYTITNDIRRYEVIQIISAKKIERFL